MNRLLITLMLATLLVAPLTTATADEIKVGYTGSSYGMYQTGQGGEFTFVPINPSGWLDLSAYVDSATAKTKNLGATATGGPIASFQTFCIEHQETIGGHGTYDADLSQNAMFGGVGGGPMGDPLSVGTGWIYRLFAKGYLPGYAYNGTLAERLASAAALQNTIWWLEQEASDPGASNPFRNAVLAQFPVDALHPLGAFEDGGWKYDVYAINLWTSTTDHSLRTVAQDGLYYRERVPEVGSLSMMGLGMFFLTGLSKKWKRS